VLNIQLCFVNCASAAQCIGSWNIWSLSWSNAGRSCYKAQDRMQAALSFTGKVLLVVELKC